MPRLRQRRDGGFYIVGPAYGGAPIATWQASEKAVEYLARHGIKAQPGRDFVSPARLAELKHLRLIWTGGTGTGAPRDTPQDLSAAALDALTRWAALSRPSELGSVLAGQDLAVAQVFSETFLKWRDRLSAREPLLVTDELSLADFEALCLQRGNYPPSGLCQQIARSEGGSKVLWQLLRLATRALQQIRTGADCPPRWQDTVLEDLLRLVGEHLADEVDREPHVYLARPYILWDVADETIRAVLPAQKIREGDKTAWFVNGVPQPIDQATDAAFRLGEAHSEALEPSDRYTIRVALSGQERREVTSEFSLPEGGRPLVLFDPKGRLISLSGHAPQEGTYLALVPPGEDPAVPHALAGVTVLDDEEFCPVSWWGWRPYSLRVDAGADLGPYGTVAQWQSVSWHLDVDEQPVLLQNVDDVVFGDWPRASVRDADRRLLEGAWLEATTDDPRRRIGPLYLVESRSSGGRSARVRWAEGRATIDLQSSDALQDVWGSICLRLHLVADPDADLPSLRFLRCPDACLAYVPDPIRPEAAMAVKVASQCATTACSDSICVDVDGTPGFRASDPAASPSVSFAFPKERAVVRVRIPVTRGRIMPRGPRSDPWKALPLRVNLGRIKINDQLRLEFVDDPELLGGELMFRLAGGNPLAAGASTGLPRTYDVPLHRWRDHLGPAVNGQVLARCASGWVPVAQLEVTHAPREPKVVIPSVDIPGPWAELAAAAGHVPAPELERLALQSVAQMDKADGSNAFQETCLIDAAKALLHAGAHAAAADVIRRLAPEAVPEAQVLQALLGLREDTSSDQELYEIAQAVQMTVDNPLKQVFMAEYAYRLARPVVKVGSLRTSVRCLTRIRWSSPIDALALGLLDSIVSFLLGEAPAIAGSEHVDDWQLCADAAREYLAAPLGACSGKPPGLPDAPPPPIWYEADARFVRMLVLQSAGYVQRAADELAELSDRGEAELPGVGLARARQRKSEGHVAEAREAYMRVHREQWRGSELVMDELPSV